MLLRSYVTTPAAHGIADDEMTELRRDRTYPSDAYAARVRTTEVDEALRRVRALHTPRLPNSPRSRASQTQAQAQLQKRAQAQAQTPAQAQDDGTGTPDSIEPYLVVRFEVRDTGAGVPRTEEHKLFVPYSQCHHQAPLNRGGGAYVV